MSRLWKSSMAEFRRRRASECVSPLPGETGRGRLMGSECSTWAALWAAGRHADTEARRFGLCGPLAPAVGLSGKGE